MSPTALLLLTGAIHSFITLVKGDQINAVLAQYGIPAIPKKVLPWLALVLGYVGGVATALGGGVAFVPALLAGLQGVISGAGAVAFQETVIGVGKTS